MRIHHIALSVKDLSKSIQFYKQFGFKEEKRFINRRINGESIFLLLEDTRLELWCLTESKSNKQDYTNLSYLGLKHIALGVKNLEKIKKELAIKQPIQESEVGRAIFIADPDGIPIELYEEQ